MESFKSTKISEVNLSAFTYRLFHENFSSIVGINPVVNSQPSTCLIDLIYSNLVGCLNRYS